MSFVRSAGVLALAACAKPTTPFDGGPSLTTSSRAPVAVASSEPLASPTSAACENVVASYPLTRAKNDIDGSLVLVTCSGALPPGEDARAALEVRTNLGTLRDRYALLRGDVSGRAEDLRGDGTAVFFTTERVAPDAGAQMFTRVWEVANGHVDAVTAEEGAHPPRFVPIVLRKSSTADWRMVARGRRKDIVWWERKPVGGGFFEERFGRISFDGNGYVAPTTESTSSDASFGLAPDGGEPAWLSEVPPPPR